MKDTLGEGVSSPDRDSANSRIELMEKCRIELIDRLKRQKAQNQEQLAETTNMLVRVKAEYEKAVARESSMYVMMRSICLS